MSSCFINLITIYCVIPRCKILYWAYKEEQDRYVPQLQEIQIIFIHELCGIL